MTRPNRGGFTLLELLLVVVIVVMLLGALVFNFTNLLRGNELQEGTTRLETLMRFARAQAANSGRKVQLVFSESTNSLAASTGEVRATWEPDPLGQPGFFADLLEAQWHVQEVNNLVQVESVKLLESNAAHPPTGRVEEEAAAGPVESAVAASLAPITFYPDGSSDSAEIIVAPRSTEEEQRMAVRLVGITGSVSHRLLSATGDPLWASDVPEESLFIPEENLLRPSDGAVDSTSSLPETRTSSRLPSPAAASASPRIPVGGTNSVGRID
ncbi:MAG: GspH/FimT family pseudopilin [Verrucomicrobiia bacterium]